MRIAVQNPSFLLGDQERNFNGYNFKFVEKYCDVIYVPRLLSVRHYIRLIHRMGWKNKKICVSPRQLNKMADVLMCFNGGAYSTEGKPVQDFHGLKIYHVMDFSNQTRRLNEALTQGGVDYLMGYARHDRHSGFFQTYFPNYIGKVIAVPFGFGARFQNLKPFDQRINKCIALGAVNPINDPLIKDDGLNDFITYYHNYEYSHEIRKMIVDHLDIWGDIFDSRLPVPPETKNPSYDAVAELNNYTMFINDESIDNFPPARTYEGIACGCVMVCTDSPIYAELGFKDGVNCIMFPKHDYETMHAKITYYIEHSDKLERIQKNSLALAEKYRHSEVAKQLYKTITTLRKES